MKGPTTGLRPTLKARLSRIDAPTRAAVAPVQSDDPGLLDLP